MSKVRRIVLVGTTSALRPQLVAEGITGQNGLEMIDVGTVDAAYKEVDRDDSVVLVVVPLDRGMAITLDEVRGDAARRLKVPAIPATNNIIRLVVDAVGQCAA